MDIRIRNNGADFVIEVDGTQFGVFCHIDGDYDIAKANAEAFTDGLRQGIEFGMASKEDAKA